MRHFDDSSTNSRYYYKYNNIFFLLNIFSLKRQFHDDSLFLQVSFGELNHFFFLVRRYRGNPRRKKPNMNKRIPTMPEKPSVLANISPILRNRLTAPSHATIVIATTAANFIEFPNVSELFASGFGLAGSDDMPCCSRKDSAK